MFDFVVRDESFQLYLNAKLHQHARRLLMRHEESIYRRKHRHDASFQRARRSSRASIAGAHSVDESSIIMTSSACITRSPFTVTVTFVLILEDCERPMRALISRDAGSNTGCKKRASRTIPRMAHRSIPHFVLANSSASGPATCAASSSMTEPGSNDLPGK